MARNLTPAQQLAVDGPRLLVDLLDEQRAAQQRVWDLGRDLVLAGTSYSALARMLGVSQQAARQRYGPHVKRWQAEHPAGDMPWDDQSGLQGWDEPGHPLDSPQAWHLAVDEAVRAHG